MIRDVRAATPQALSIDKIPFVRPLLPDFELLSGGLASIIATAQLTKGPRLREFEQRLAVHLGVRHAVAVSSCTSGLMLTYQGLGLKGEVIVPSFTFMATVTAMAWTNLTPVFVDVRRQTTNINPDAIAEAITPRTCAIAAVHNFGNPADINALEQIADRHGLRLIFDAAHGFGTLYNGVPVGPQGDAHIFSLSPTKLLVAGEGGVVATNDDHLANAIRLGREYGNDGSYDCLFPGLNARMPEMSALVGLHGLDLLEAAAQQRNAQASRYRELLSPLPGLEFIEVRAEDRCSYKDFSILIDLEAFGVSRDRLGEILADAGIETRKYYDPPVHRQAAFRHLAPPSLSLPETDVLAAGSLSLPVGAHITNAHIDRITEIICRAYYRGSAFAGSPQEVHSES